MRKLGLLVAVWCGVASAIGAELSDALHQFPSTKEYAERDADAGFLYYLYEAARLKAVGKADSALTCLNRCDSINPKNAQVHAELAKIYFEKNDAIRAEFEIEKSVELDSTNINNLEMQARIALANRNYTMATTSLESIIRQNPSQVNYYTPLATIYTEIGKPKDALRVWSELEKVMGYKPDITYSKFAIWINKLQDKANALAEYDKAIEAQPYSTEYVKEKARAQKLLGDDKGAVETLRKGTPMTKGNSAYTMALAQLFVEKGDAKSLDKTIDKVIDDRTIEYDEKSELVKKIMGDNQTEKVMTEKRLKRLIANYPNEYTTYLFYAQLLGEQGKDDKAMAMIKKSLDANPDQEQTWALMIEVYKAKGDSVMLERVLPEALKSFPKSPYFHYDYGVILYTNKGDAKGGAKEMDKAAELFKESDVLKAAEAKGDAGDLYGVAKDTTNCLLKYEEALALNPNSAEVLNNYAYSLAIYGMNLDKAEKMGAKAVLIAPRNSAYLDTFAWIYFLKGNYSASLLYIEQAMRNAEKPSAEGSEHYGDILYKNGEKEKAKEMWNRAVELSGKDASETLKEKARTGELK